MLVYKYVVPERIDILENGCIRFSQADALNDPFEIYPSYDLYKKSVRNMYYEIKGFESSDIIRGKPELENSFQPEISKIQDKLRTENLILSLTKERNNLIMWSHYTNAHRGFVIGFDSASSFFYDQTKFLIMEVEYSDHRATMSELGKITIEESLSLYLKCFFTKSTHWKYEKELRMLAKPEDGKILEQKDANNLKIHVFNFPPNSIKEIIFGYLMESGLKQKILEIIEKRYFSVELFEAYRSEINFDLDIKPSQQIT